MIAGAFFRRRFYGVALARFAGPQQCGLPHAQVLMEARPSRIRALRHITDASRGVL
ncbi:hypothetical protein HDG33_007492 [Paraburkholderia sp. Cpub6]|nr:hypothetical protein [Paraburkholderia sp. Cpub6]